MGSKKYHDEDWLREKYHGEQMTMRDIGDLCGVTTTTISDWMDRHGIEKRDRSGAQLPDGKHTDREWLAEQYHGKGRPLKEIADECDVNPVTIMNWMDKYDIPRRGYTDHFRVERVNIVHRPDGYVDAKTREPQSADAFTASVKIHQLVAIAEGADPYKIFSDGEHQCHHINGVKWDNRPENIEVLSQSEHDRLHAAERERAPTGEFL